mmetsp:Transcript_127385/g.271576  ORF Transcript_127385/g.271576 Transcript_127385/m.271576 type:complete len:275 (+) Transcript_127385:255-1079(+)
MRRHRPCATLSGRKASRSGGCAPEAWSLSRTSHAKPRRRHVRPSSASAVMRPRRLLPWTPSGAGSALATARATATQRVGSSLSPTPPQGARRPQRRRTLGQQHPKTGPRQRPLRRDRRPRARMIRTRMRSPRRTMRTPRCSSAWPPSPRSPRPRRWMPPRWWPRRRCRRQARPVRRPPRTWRRQLWRWRSVRQSAAPLTSPWVVALPPLLPPRRSLVAGPMPIPGGGRHHLLSRQPLPRLCFSRRHSAWARSQLIATSPLQVSRTVRRAESGAT